MYWLGEGYSLIDCYARNTSKPNQIGRKISKIRELKGIKQEELARDFLVCRHYNASVACYFSKKSNLFRALVSWLL